MLKNGSLLEGFRQPLLDCCLG